MATEFLENHILIRSQAIDDADSIIRAFHLGIKLGRPVDLLPNMTEAEKAALATEEKTLEAEKPQSGIAA